MLNGRRLSLVPLMGLRLRKVLRPPSYVGCGGFQGIRAGSYPCGGDTASDDVAIGDDFPIRVAGQTVRRDSIKEGVFSSHDAPHWKSGEGAPSVSTKSLKLTNRRSRRSRQNCSVRNFFVIKIAHLAMISRLRTCFQPLFGPSRQFLIVVGNPKHLTPCVLVFHLVGQRARSFPHARANALDH